MVPYLNESCKSLSDMSSGPHGQTSAPAHEFGSVNVSNEVRKKSCSLHKSVYSALQRDHFVCVGSHSGIPAEPALCNVKFPGIVFQFCGGDSWYTFHVMYLWVAPVDLICFELLEPVGNNMPKSTTVCLDYFNEIVPCISRCPSRQHLASHKHVCDLFFEKVGWCDKDVVKLSVLASLMPHMRKCSLCVKKGQRTANVISNALKGTPIASSTLKCKAVGFKTALGM